MDVGDVGVAPDHDVPPHRVQALPERLALAGEAAQLREDLRVLVDRHAVRAGDLDGAVRRVGVDHHDLVEQWVAVHQPGLEDADDLSYGLALVERWQGQADGDALGPLQLHQPLDVTELARVEGVLGEPAVHHGGDVRAAAGDGE